MLLSITPIGSNFASSVNRTGAWRKLRPGDRERAWPQDGPRVGEIRARDADMERLHGNVADKLALRICARVQPMGENFFFVPHFTAICRY